MEKSQAPITRRLGLVRGTHLLLAAAVMVMAGTPRTVKAAKADKKDFFYQDKPNAGRHCSTCNLYSVSPSGKSVCAIIDGEISADGWCMAYSPRA
ncbi:MAG: high-potential iron-sulfur protein [Comamonadaceae bacterium]